MRNGYQGAICRVDWYEANAPAWKRPRPTTLPHFVRRSGSATHARPSLLLLLTCDVQDVGTGTANASVVAGVADQGVDAVAAHDAVVSASARDNIGARAT